MKLWPRLPLPRAQAMLSEFAGASCGELKALDWRSREKAYAPTGGIPITDDELAALRRDLEHAAGSFGFPSPLSADARSRFDRAVTLLLSGDRFPAGEALRAEMWAWVTTILAPHVVEWRWPRREGGPRIERFAGSLLRNAFGRLWYAAYVLDRGPEADERWAAHDALGADQFVSLLERPSIAGNRLLGRAVAEFWARQDPRVRQEKLFREAMKALLVRASICRLDVLDPADVDKEVSAVFADTAARLYGTKS